MNYFSDERFAKVVRNACAQTGEQELRRDLWSEVQLKLHRPIIRISWFDWVLVAVVVVLCLINPESAGGLLLHL